MKDILDMLQKYYADKAVTISCFKDELKFVSLINGKVEILCAWTINDIRKVMYILKTCDKKEDDLL